MKTQCSSTENEISDNILKLKSPYEILHNTICNSLKFNCNLAYTHCIGKIGIFCKATSSCISLFIKKEGNDFVLTKNIENVPKEQILFVKL